MWIGLFQKKHKQGGWAEDMEFQWVLKKEHVEIPGFNWNRSGISKCVYEKLVEIPCVLVFDLVTSKGCHTILQNSQR